MDKKWSKPVLVAFEEPGHYTSIDTTQAASWAMIEDWPTEDGEALDRALPSTSDIAALVQRLSPDGATKGKP